MSLLLLLSSAAASDGLYVITGRITPDARSDATPWTTLVIEEGETSEGPWTQIDSIPLSPDSDPADPQPRPFTTENATLPAGWYRATFFDAAESRQTTAPEYIGPPLRPTVGDIGALLHSRTTVDGGGETGTFNDQTDPTGDEVRRLIDVATSHIAIQVPASMTSEQVAYARTMVGYLAAILVEKSHFTDQVESGNSLAPLYEDLLTTGMVSLLGLVNNDNTAAPRAYGTPIGTVIAATTADLVELLP